MKTETCERCQFLYDALIGIGGGILLGCVTIMIADLFL